MKKYCEDEHKCSKNKMKHIIKTLGLIKWDDLKINEIFALSGCWNILIKTGKKSAKLIADDYSSYLCAAPMDNYNCYGSCICGDTYKLPIAVQRLWKQGE